MSYRLLAPVVGIALAASLACMGGDDDKPASNSTMQGDGTEDSPLQAACSNYGKDLGGAVGDSFWVKCPAGCTSSSVWGSNPYTIDSYICTAAIHAGALDSGGGKVEVSVAKGLSEYPSSAKNGVKSSSWGAYDTSMKIEGSKKAAKKEAAAKEEAKDEPAAEAEPAEESTSGGGGKKGGGGGKGSKAGGRGGRKR